MYMCCFALFVCLTLLASFFLPSHLSFKNMCICVYIHVYSSNYYSDILLQHWGIVCTCSVIDNIVVFTIRGMVFIVRR